MRFRGSGGVLHLESPGTASLPNVCPVQGWVRRGGTHVAIANARAVCRLMGLLERVCLLTGQEYCASHLAMKESTMNYMQFQSVGWVRYTPRTRRRLDTYAFVGVVVATMVVIHHSYITRRVAEGTTSPLSKIRDSRIHWHA